MQDKKAEKDFFNSFVENGEYDVFDERGYGRIVNELTSLIPVTTNRQTGLLDVGCGTGAFTKRLVQKNMNLFGLDISFNS